MFNCRFSVLQKDGKQKFAKTGLYIERRDAEGELIHEPLTKENLEKVANPEVDYEFFIEQAKENAKNTDVAVAVSDVEKGKITLPILRSNESDWFHDWRHQTDVSQKKTGLIFKKDVKLADLPTGILQPATSIEKVGEIGPKTKGVKRD